MAATSFPPHANRRTAVMLATIAGLALIVGAALWRAGIRSPAPDGPTRHTLSRGEILVPLGEFGETWLRVAFERETWISPDGSGRIQERYLGEEPANEIERSEWVASGRPTLAPIIGDFPAGGLVYWILDNVPRDPALLSARLKEGDPAPGEMLRRVSSLLTETDPPAEVVEAVVQAVQLIPDISMSTRAGVVTMTGALADERNTLITLEIDGASGRFLGEQHTAMGPVEFLSESPPVPMLRREVFLSESLEEWAPTEP